MNKLKKSILVKIILAILFMLSGAIFLGTGAVSFFSVKDEMFTVEGVQQYIKNEKENIANFKSIQIMSYYQMVIDNKGDISQTLARDFSSENSNMSFSVYPTYKDDKFIRWENYKMPEEEVDFSGSIATEYSYREPLEVEYKLSKEDIISKFKKEYDGIDFLEYKDFDIRFDFQNYYARFYINPDYECSLNVDDFPEIVNSIKNDIENIRENDVYTDAAWQDIAYITKSEYDSNRGALKLQIELDRNIPFTIDYSVRKNCTAKDDFYYDWTLRIGAEKLHDYITICFAGFVISGVMLLIFFCLICAVAGYSGGKEGISLTLCGKIPYEIYGLIAGFCLALMADPVSFLIMLFILIVTFTLFLFAIVERIKANEFLNGSLIIRLIKNSLSFIRQILKNANQVIVLVGACAVVSIVELGIVSASGVDFAGVLFFLAIDLFLVGWFAGKYIINLKEMLKITKKLADGEIDYNDPNSTRFSLPEKYKCGFFDEFSSDVEKIKKGINIQVEERLKSEKMKAELITNVSHDIKTPLTSIINYVDLIKKEDIAHSKVKEYVEVLDRQSVRLKKLVQDLIDASKAASGNVKTDLVEMDVNVIMEQILAEYDEKFKQKNLTIVQKNDCDSSIIKADGKILWRVFDNLFGNIYKYAMDNTRVYIDIENFDSDVTVVEKKSNKLKISIKNISKESINMSGAELRERFVRGDSSRNTEGSGLGLSIAEDLLKLQDMDFDIFTDGDFFKAIIIADKI